LLLRSAEIKPSFIDLFSAAGQHKRDSRTGSMLSEGEKVNVHGNPEGGTFPADFNFLEAVFPIAPRDFDDICTNNFPRPHGAVIRCFFPCKGQAVPPSIGAGTVLRPQVVGGGICFFLGFPRFARLWANVFCLCGGA
jgi:hypothetical protein